MDATVRLEHELVAIDAEHDVHGTTHRPSTGARGRTRWLVRHLG